MPCRIRRIALIVMSAPESLLTAGQQEMAMDQTWADRLEYAGVAVEEPGYPVWGSSPIIGPNSNTHLFVARWPVSSGFGDWHTACEIARYVADPPEGPFIIREALFLRKPQWVAPPSDSALADARPV